MSTILSLAPQNVWKHFYSLTQIPRPSGHMEKVTEFLINFGKGLGLESFVDEAGNVIIRKPVTKMKVLKFGGTSVGSAQRMKEVAKLITDGEQKIGL